MTTYYEVHVDETSKPMGNKIESGRGYSLFNQEVMKFKTFAEVKEFIKNKYSGHKKSKIYRDIDGGSSKHIGYTYSFRNREYDRNGDYSYYQQDWVTVYEIKSTNIII